MRNRDMRTRGALGLLAGILILTACGQVESTAQDASVAFAYDETALPGAKPWTC